MINSMGAGLHNATFANISDKIKRTEVLQMYKPSLVDLIPPPSEIKGVLKHDEPEDEPTLQAAMLASSHYNPQRATIS